MESPGQHGQLLAGDAQRCISCHTPAQCPGWLGAGGLGAKEQGGDSRETATPRAPLGSGTQP